MEPQKLNIDVFCEIFKYFVAIDDDGPLTLIMVCTLWQGRVISNPLYWTWITIDDKMGDFNARIQTFDALSAGCPLQLTIRLPVRNVDRFKTLFGRCQALFIDKCGQIDPLEIEKDVQGICSILKTPPARLIERIYWYNRDEPTVFSPRSLQEQLFRAGELDLQPVFDTFPATIISTITLKLRINIFRPRESYFNVCKALSNLPYLTNLHLSTDRLGGIFEEAMTHISLPLLHSLSLENRSLFSDSSWIILGYIIAPTVHSVRLAGILKQRHIFAGASELGKSMRPRKLTLEILENADLSGDSKRALDYNLASVEYFTVSLQAPGANWDTPSRWHEELHSVLASMPYLALFDLRFSGDLACFQDIIGPISCNLRVHCQSPFQGQASSSEPFCRNNIPSYNMDKIATEIGPPVNSCGPVEQLTVLIGRYGLQRIFTQLKIPVSSVKTLIVRVPEAAGDDLDSITPLFTPLGWLASLQELDITGLIPYNSNIFSNMGISLQNLVILKCPIWVASQLIRYVHTPQLHELKIAGSDPIMSRMDQRDFEHLMIQATNDDINKWPQLSSVAIEFYPRWKTFLEMVSMYSRPHENQRETILRRVGLPAFPHPSILQPLVSALRGEHSAAKNVPSIPFHARRYESCDFCHRSGWKCAYLMKNYCDRHSLLNLTTITSDTLGG
jgi:hypothetical protein